MSSSAHLCTTKEWGALESSSGSSTFAPTCLFFLTDLPFLRPILATCHQSEI